MSEGASFYIKNKDQDTYQSNKLTTNSTIERIVNKLQMILLGNKGMVLGDYDMGCNLEYYVWNTFASNSDIESVITEQIKKYIPEMYTIGFHINVYFERGDFRDICIVDIELPGDEYVQAIFK